MNGYLDFNVDVLHAATNNRYADGNGVRLANLEPIAFLRNYKITTFSNKHLEDISNAHIVLTYKLITSAQDTDDSSICFDRDRNRRQRALTNNKSIKRKYHLGVYLKDILGFAEHQEKATYDLAFKITLTRKVDNAVLNKANATNIGKLKINAFEWYVPQYTPSIPQQSLLSKQILSKTATELQYVESSVFMTEVKTQKLRIFEIGTHEVINVHIWIVVGFKQKERQDSQKICKDTFFRLSVTSAQCIIGTEK